MRESLGHGWSGAKVRGPLEVACSSNFIYYFHVVIEIILLTFEKHYSFSLNSIIVFHYHLTNSFYKL